MQNLFEEAHSDFFSGKKTMLGEKFQVSGTLRGSDDVVIEGKFDGEINLKAKLYVSRTAYIKADLNVESVIIYGEVDGNIQSSNLIEVKSGSTVYGDMQAPHISIEDGSRVHGRVNITG